MTLYDAYWYIQSMLSYICFVFFPSLSLSRSHVFVSFIMWMTDASILPTNHLVSCGNSSSSSVWFVTWFLSIDNSCAICALFLHFVIFFLLSFSLLKNDIWKLWLANLSWHCIGYCLAEHSQQLWSHLHNYCASGTIWQKCSRNNNSNFGWWVCKCLVFVVRYNLEELLENPLIFAACNMLACYFWFFGIAKASYFSPKTRKFFRFFCFCYCCRGYFVYLDLYKHFFPILSFSRLNSDWCWLR